jgi:putative transposase
MTSFLCCATDFIWAIDISGFRSLRCAASALVVVHPETMVRWHRAGWRLFWRLKSRPGRSPIPKQVQALIWRMKSENPTWGEERIANELLLKLGIQISPRTVRKYLPPRPPGRPRGDRRWSTFLRLHAQGIIACDFFVVVTAAFRLLYVFVVIEHGSRRLVHCNVTAHPSAAWTLQQLREAVGWDPRYMYLLHDGVYRAHPLGGLKGSAKHL